MVRIILLFLCFVAVPSVAVAQNKKTAGRIIDTLYKIKEVNERFAYVEKQSGGERHLSFVFFTKPTKKDPYYWVKVLEYNNVSNVTHFNFFVYPKPFSIMYYDTVRDTVISIDEWRRERSNQN
ncbi:MAG: hypothetical protein JNM41_04555 [Flavipsychrobacter sp.]|nr:hypothetical protein [Flavipsychrobacter sp.]